MYFGVLSGEERKSAVLALFAGTGNRSPLNRKLSFRGALIVCFIANIAVWSSCVCVCCSDAFGRFRSSIESGFSPNSSSVYCVCVPEFDNHFCVFKKVLIFVSFFWVENSLRELTLNRVQLQIRNRTIQRKQPNTPNFQFPYDLMQIVMSMCSSFLFSIPLIRLFDS